MPKQIYDCHYMNHYVSGQKNPPSIEVLVEVGEDSRITEVLCPASKGELCRVQPMYDHETFDYEGDDECNVGPGVRFLGRVKSDGD